jgi:hypothetical protein
MENYLGRLLDDEVVHHLNHDRKDNRIENLELCFEEEHQRMPEVERAISENLVMVYSTIHRQLRANCLTTGCVETIRLPSETTKK